MNNQIYNYYFNTNQFVKIYFHFQFYTFPVLVDEKKYGHKKTPDKIEGSKVGELLFFILKELEFVFI